MKMKVLILIVLSIVLCACGTMDDTRTPSPTEESISPGDGPSIEDQLEEVDEKLGQSMRASFAYSAPESLQLDQTGTVKLLIDPSSSPEELATQVVGESGGVVSGSLEITTRMKAELKPQNPGAFELIALHDSAEQIVSKGESTKWQWWVTARKEGRQHLTLVVYRLVKYEGHDYWREVQSYQSDIVINVTLAQRLQSNWAWLAGLLTALLLAIVFWRWADARKKKRDEHDRPDVTNIYVGHDV